MLTRRSLLSMIAAGIASVAVSTRLAASELAVKSDEFTRWLAEPDSEWLVCFSDGSVYRLPCHGIPADTEATWAIVEVAGHDRAHLAEQVPLLTSFSPVAVEIAPDRYQGRRRPLQYGPVRNYYDNERLLRQLAGRAG